MSREYYFGDEARIQCYKGYKLTGANIIRCGIGQEFQNPPKCEGNESLVFKIIVYIFLMKSFFYVMLHNKYLLIDLNIMLSYFTSSLEILCKMIC